MLDPRKQECFGHYLYGAGALARDENTLGLVLGRETGENFCMRCTRREECEIAHQERVTDQSPEAVEQFARTVKEAERRGYPTLLVVAYLGKKGLDPFAAAAVENFSKGHADRGRRDGALVG